MMDAGPDAGADAGTDAAADAGSEDDGGTFVSPGPFALEWVACLGDPGLAYEGGVARVVVLNDGRIAVASQVRYPTISSFLTILASGGAIAWSADYISVGSFEESQIGALGVVETDKGDLAISGAIYGTVTLESPSGADIQLAAVDDGRDCFLARYSADGALLWAISVGSIDGDYTDSSSDIVAAPDDTVIVSGFVGGPAVFGEGESNETTLPSQGAFLARYNADGALLWAKGTTGGFAYGSGLALVSGNEIVLVGGILDETAGDTVTFGSGETNETKFTVEGAGDIFVARYAVDDGTLQWAVRAGSSEGTEEYGWNVAALGSGAVLVGYYQGEATFGDQTLSLDESESGFIAASAPDGDFPWAKSVGLSGGNDRVYGVAADTEGLYAVGFVGGPTATFGYGEPEETIFSLEYTGLEHAFIARYGFGGALAWAGLIPSADLESCILPSSVTSVGADEFVVGGNYNNNSSVPEIATFGYDDDGNPVTCDGVHEHPFVAKYRVQ
ncbi:MAG: hypothetical protein WC457_02280 [Patescibacteria group bacterium]